jgi:hypothetical protein
MPNFKGITKDGKTIGLISVRRPIKEIANIFVEIP